MTIRTRLDRFINCTATELTIGILIVVSILLIILEVTTPPESPELLAYELLGDAITALFIVELGIRWYVARSTRYFWREYWLDVVAVLPLTRPLRVLRVLRLLRLTRLGFRLSRRTRKLASLVHEGLAQNVLIVAILVVVFLFGAIGITIVEKNNPAFATFRGAVWWSLFTMMAGEPIGGEPTTLMGRVVTLGVMLGGFTIFAVFTGVVSAVMVARLRLGTEAKDMELEELRDHYLICGWNRSGPRIVQELQTNPETSRRPIVIVAELQGDPDLPLTRINAGLIFFVRDDYTSADVLHRVRVEYARRAILLADRSQDRSDQDRDARTVLAALTIEKLHHGIHTCAELLNRDNSKVLELAGVEEILVGDECMGNLIAHSTRTAGLVQVLDELLSSEHGNEFYRVETPPALAGKTVVEALPKLKQDRGFLLVAVETSEVAARDPCGDGETQETDERRIVLTNPPPDYRLRSADRLLVIGKHSEGRRRDD